MKIILARTLILFAVFALMAGAALAKEETHAVSSKKCDVNKLKKIGGEAVVKIEKGTWEGGYNVTLNTDKLSFNDFLQKIAKEGCN